MKTTPKAALHKLETQQLINQYRICEEDAILNKLCNHSQRTSRRALIVDLLFARADGGDTAAEAWVQVPVEPVKVATVVSIKAPRARKSVAQ